MQKKRVLFIDDDEDILSIITIVLAEESIEVIASADLSYEKILELKPDLIMLDEWLGDKKGSNICTAIKNFEGLSSIPVMLISAINNLREVAEVCNADAYLGKPFDIAHLVKVVKSLIKT